MREYPAGHPSGGAGSGKMDVLRRFGISVLVAVVAGCGGGGGEGADDDGGPDAAPEVGVDAEPTVRPEPGPILGDFELTYYWMTAEDEFKGAADTDIYDDACDVLATVPAAYADDLDLEGTGRLADGRVVNVSGACGCARSPCYMEVDAEHPWGYGVQDRALVPYRTFAVDPDVIPYGTPLYFAELDGEPMPGDAPWGDFIHDGCAVAGDTGGAIVGMHVDWFVALRDSYRLLDERLGLTEITVRAGGERCVDWAD
jgi:3D (Asp-Asp-Asp) domain-containing protein